MVEDLMCGKLRRGVGLFYRHGWGSEYRAGGAMFAADPSLVCHSRSRVGRKWWWFQWTACDETLDRCSSCLGVQSIVLSALACVLRSAPLCRHSLPACFLAYIYIYSIDLAFWLSNKVVKAASSFFLWLLHIMCVATFTQTLLLCYHVIYYF